MPLATVYVLQPLPHPSRRNCCEAIQNAPDGMEVEIRAKRVQRSSEANRHYWAMLQQIAQDGWIDGRRFTAETWHEFYKRRFIGIIDGPCGTSIAESSSKLTRKEFADYVQKVEVHAASELRISFVDPAEDYRVGA